MGRFAVRELGSLSLDEVAQQSDVAIEREQFG
jgi:hypothetical protein